MKKDEKQEKAKPQGTNALAGDLKRRLDWIAKREKNVDTEIEVLEKRHKKYTDGIPKVEAQLKELKAKKKQLAERKQKELKVVENLAKTFLPQQTEEK